MLLGDLGVLLAMAGVAAIAGRTIAGYGLGATLAAVGVAFAAAVTTAMVSAVAGAPRLIPGTESTFAFGWAALGALTFVVLPAWLIRRSVERNAQSVEASAESPSPQPHVRSALRSLSQSSSGS